MIAIQYGMFGEVIGYQIPNPESMMPQIGLFIHGIFYPITH
jgi:hypothetical protein